MPSHTTQKDNENVPFEDAENNEGENTHTDKDSTTETSPENGDVSKEEATQTEETNEESEMASDLEKKLKEQSEKHLRLLAEFENFKRRNAQERIELFKSANKEVVLALLPVLDDFERCLDQLSKEKLPKGSIKGVKIVVNKLLDTLKAKGLEPIGTKKGDDFDVDKHEAVTKLPDPKLKGKIVDVIEKGYFLNGIIIRYAKVVVGA